MCSEKSRNELKYVHIPLLLSSISLFLSSLSCSMQAHIIFMLIKDINLDTPTFCVLSRMQECEEKEVKFGRGFASMPKQKIVEIASKGCVIELYSFFGEF